MGTYATVAASSLVSTLGAGVEGAAGVDEALPLLDFSLLKTLLILFTYLPRLFLRSTSLVSGVADSAGVDILKEVQWVGTGDSGAADWRGGREWFARANGESPRIYRGASVEADRSLVRHAGGQEYPRDWVVVPAETATKPRDDRQGGKRQMGGIAIRLARQCAVFQCLGGATQLDCGRRGVTGGFWQRASARREDGW